MPLLTNTDIAKRFKTDENDTAELLNIQNKGVDYGKRGVAIDGEEFDDDVRFDIEHTETLLDLKEGSVLRLFKAGYREGLALRKSFCLPIDSVSEVASRPAGARRKQAQPKAPKRARTQRRRAAANVTPTVADDIAAAAKPDDQKSTWTAETPHA